MFPNGLEGSGEQNEDHSRTGGTDLAKGEFLLQGIGPHSFGSRFRRVKPSTPRARLSVRPVPEDLRL
jgi:hypothetical protein